MIFKYYILPIGYFLENINLVFSILWERDRRVKKTLIALPVIKLCTLHRDVPGMQVFLFIAFLCSLALSCSTRQMQKQF